MMAAGNMIYLAQRKSGAPQFLFNSIYIHASLLIE